MEVNELKKLINNSTAVLVLDNGEPSFVILGYKMYKDLVSDHGAEKEITINHPTDVYNNGSVPNVSNVHEREAEILERLNKEILALKNQIEMEEKGLSSPRID